MVKRSVWDWLAWIAIISIAVWALLKGFGVFNTPVLLEVYPYLAVSYVFGWQANKLSSVCYEVKDLKKFRNDTIKQINEIKLNCVKNHGQEICIY
ncbi:MAG: hypothetical protein V1888_03595 [archaeon]